MFFSKFSIALCSLVLLATPASGPAFRGTAAFLYTKKAVSYGERPSGSEAISQMRDWIVSNLKPLKGQISLQSFTGQTPTGPVPMVNIICKFPGSSGKALVVTGHYDTKRIPMVHFVGANDGGSSTGFLLEFARAISTMKHRDDIYVVFLDGEEAIAHWTETDSRYGSRYLAAKWLSEGVLPNIKALINVDMIGDKNLDILNDGNSSRALRSQILQIAARLGYSKSFRSEEGGIDDDHIPFINAGVNAIDLIDFDFGPRNSYWHTAEDTIDKLDAHSFQVVGDVVLELIKEWDQRG